MPNTPPAVALKPAFTPLVVPFTSSLLDSVMFWLTVMSLWAISVRLAALLDVLTIGALTTMLPAWLPAPAVLSVTLVPAFSWAWIRSAPICELSALGPKPGAPSLAVSPAPATTSMLNGSSSQWPPGASSCSPATSRRRCAEVSTQPPWPSAPRATIWPA